MSEKSLSNLGASVRQRLRNRAREDGTDFEVILCNYALERLLYRISRSKYRDGFVLKGAMLFRVWSEEPHRATRDLDLLAYCGSAAEEVVAVFRILCAVSVEDDGLEFQADSLRTEEIREDQEYGGVRVRLYTMLGATRIPLKIDIGFGDVVTPAAEELSYPTILGLPAPVIRAYPKEAVIAEKFHAMVALGMADSRMKDFYDIYVLAAGTEFDGHRLGSAFKATFNRRTTLIPSGVPTALSPEYSGDALKRAQWKAFAGGGNVRLSSVTLNEVIRLLGLFLLPPANSVAQGRRFDGKWVPPGPWDS